MAPTAFPLLQLHSTLIVPGYHQVTRRQGTTSRPETGDWRQAATDEELILESWSQGVVVGALMIMGCITVANMRRGVLLHKLILAELLLAMSHGTFCFMSFRGYGWYLSSTAMLLYSSWVIHNIVAWLKVRPFFSQPGGFFKPTLGVWTTRIYLGTLALSVPVVIFQVSNNFRFFNNRGGWYKSTRPYEPLMRDPWWIFTCAALFHVIQKCYGTGAMELLRRSPRFGILLGAIFLSLVFTACDIAASISSTAIIGQTEGINPWWKLSLVFKCLTDTIMLDDFKTELKRLGIKRIAKEEKRRNTISLVDDHDAHHSEDERRHRSGSHWRKPSRWFGSGSIDRSSSTGDLSPTTSIQEPNGPSPDGHINSKKSKALNDPNADIDELEFSTALFLDPSQLSGVESTRNNSDHHSHQQGSRQPQQRNSITSHTKQISHLPSLKQWRFEPIKSNQARSSSESDPNDEPPRRIDAEIEPSTVESHRTVANADIQTSQADQSVESTHLRFSNVDPTGRQQDTTSHQTESTASQERVRRFKQSIGA